ncbi:MAG TPA: type IV toxin-antitoxin system AbiEi family antitoxin domain-containing protein [Actinomycetota bacterium]
MDELVAEGTSVVTPSAIRARTGASVQATVNMLSRLVEAGLLDRVARGRYVIRPIGLLGTSAAAEDLALAVAAVFIDKPHRIAFRSALDHHGLLLHPARTVQVACTSRVKVAEVSRRPLRVILEKDETVLVGAERAGESRVSNLERALIDAASRPELIGGVEVLAHALAMSSPNIEDLLRYGRRLDAGAAIRRIGSLADQLAIPGLSGRLRPLAPPKSDVALDTSTQRQQGSWRDRRWFVRWDRAVEDLAHELRQ